jgi:ABC-2 type transport system permease protein
MSSAVEAELSDLTNSLNQPTVSPRILQQTALDIVELYPYIEYMKYLLPGSLVLAMFVSVMIGGGMLYIDDKARGVHEGYLVTPITKLELVLGLNLAGAIKAVMTGVIIVGIGSMMAGVSTIFNPVTLFGLLIMIVLTSLAFNTMMFLLMVRIEDPTSLPMRWTASNACCSRRPRSPLSGETCSFFRSSPPSRWASPFRCSSEPCKGLRDWRIWKLSD